MLIDCLLFFYKTVIFNMIRDNKINVFLVILGILVRNAAFVKGIPTNPTTPMAIQTTTNIIFSHPCVMSCIFTEEYNPVCANDGHTYPNPSYLSCFQQDCWLLQIKKVHDGPCVPKSADTTSSYGSFTYPTIRTTPSNPIYDDPCVQKCQITTDLKPLCGSDGRDYANPSLIACFQECGKPITKVHDGPCASNQYIASSSYRTSSFRPTTNPPIQTTRPNPIYGDPCVQKCNISTEYEPVCGTDDRTYVNPSFITCFQECGKPISKVHDGRCDNDFDTVASTTHRTTTYSYRSSSFRPSTYSAIRTTPYNSIFEDPCVRKCNITIEYKPFCGSDGREYDYPSLIPCFQDCGKTITKAYDGFCNSKK